LYEIEEIELDPEYCNPYKGCRYYFVTAHKRRWPTELPISFTTDEGQLPRALGGVFEVYEIDSHQRGAVRFNKLQEDTGGPSLKMDGMALSLSRSYRLVGWEATTIVIAESKEAAIKVANERVMQAIARGELEAFHKKHGIVSPT
jgi:hypothetical protein